ncbi:chloride channel protein [Corynebacterium gerontici]|uniref:H(+)/Cl(-) exchange transporter ClcA n=1 Tax=Corynebacterium gerontici TaxID=2079234 RepID=A0A3G6IZC5_9CORY|nr:chloride channel protein [Corynebacterium gerontici]AZA11135.1 H(+)/Cl(-) exchange transporter ClcA [Corynebacterium gerontici]
MKPLAIVSSLVTVGVAAGLIGAGMTMLVHLIEHSTTWYFSMFLAVLGASMWWWLRGRNHSLLHVLVDATAQLIVVGAGASLGREQAPRQVASAIAQRVWIPETYKRHLSIAAAGAGLAAVYNIPIAGALYAIEVLGRKCHPTLVIFAALASGIATVTAWPLIGNHAFYSIPDAAMNTTTLLLLLPTMLLGGGLGWVFSGLAQRQIHRRVSGTWLMLSVPSAVVVVLLVAEVLPAVTGNGQLVLDLAFHSNLHSVEAAALLLAKLALTCLCLRAGARGGVLTPSLAVGGAAGAMLAAFVGADAVALALFGGAAALAVTQRAPLFAAMMAIELTHPDPWVVASMLGFAIPASALLARRQSGQARR